MKTFESGVTGMGLKIRLDTQGIHLIRPGVFGSKEEFWKYSFGKSLTSSTSFVGVTTILFDETEKLKGFDREQAEQIEKIYAYGRNNQFVELVDLVGIDGQEFEDTPSYKAAIDKLKAEYLQEQADKAAKIATEALNAQALAAQAAASAAKAYDRHQNAANKAVYDASVTAIQGAVPPTPQIADVYIAVNGQQQGPFDMSQLKQMVAVGQVTPDTMVWKQGMASWASASLCPDLVSLFSSTPGSGMPPVPPSL